MAELNVRVISKLAALLARGGEEAEGAARTLWNMSVEGPETRAATLTSGAVLAILPYLRPETAPELLRVLTQTFSNLCRHADDEPPVELDLVSPALPLVKELLYKGDQHVLEAACVALTNIMHGTTENIEAVQAVPGLTVRLVALIGHKADKVRCAALGAMANMLAGTNTQVDRCLHVKCIEPIAFLLRSSKPFSELAARAIGNIFTHTHLIQRALEMDALTPLQNMLANGEAECQMQAAKAIGSLCLYGTPAQRDQLVSSGVLQPYCALLAAADGTLAALVVAGLHTLVLATEEDDTDFEIDEPKLKGLCMKLGEAGTVHLMQQLQSQAINEDLRRQAHELSITICFYERGEDLIFEDGKVFTPAEMVKVLKFNPRATHTSAARAARRMLSRARGDGATRLQSVSDIMVKADILEPLMAASYEAAMYNCPNLEPEAVWALANITFAKEHIITAVLEAGVVTFFVTYLSKDGEVALHAASALGNIASHGTEARDAVLNAGAVQALLPHLLPETPLRDLRIYLCTCNVLCSSHGSSESEACKLLLPALSSILELLHVEDERVLENACEVVNKITMGPNERIESVQAVPGLTARLVTLMGHEATSVRKAALGPVANMLAGTNTQVDRCFDANCLEPIVSFLSSDEPSLAEVAAISTANIFAHTHSEQRALDIDILTPLRNMLANGEGKCLNPAVRVVYNLGSYGTAAQRDQLVSSGVLEPYCALLANPDITLVELVVKGLQVLMQAAEKDDSRDCKLKILCLKLNETRVIDLIQQLQSQTIAEDIRHQAMQLSIIIRFYAREEDLIFEDGRVFTPADIVKELKSQNLVTQMRATRLAHRMLLEARKETLIRLRSFTDIVKAGVLALMEAFDKDDSPDIQFEAVCKLTNITTVRGHIMAVIEVGAIPKLVTLISKDGEVALQAASALGNIASYGIGATDAVLNAGAVQALLPHLRPETPLRNLRIYLCTFKMCCRRAWWSTPHKFTVSHISAALPSISELLRVADQDVLVNACGALQNISIEMVQAVPGLMARLVSLLGHEDAVVQLAALGVVNNMVRYGIPSQVFDDGCLDHIVPLLQHSKPSIVELAVKLIFKIFSHSELKERVLEKDIFPLLRNILANGEPETQLAAAKAITSAWVGTTTAAVYTQHTRAAAEYTELVESGVLEQYCALLASPDHHILYEVLVGLKWLLRSTRGGCLNADVVQSQLKQFGVYAQIMRLQNHEDTEISNAVSRILELW